jgi:hypothetical protein
MNSREENINNSGKGEKLYAGRSRRPVLVHVKNGEIRGQTSPLKKDVNTGR